MGFNALEFFQDNNIPYLSEGHKHCRPDWIQIKCPFCIGTDGWHLGFDLINGWFNCWRCGPHRVWDVVLELVDGDISETRRVVGAYHSKLIERTRIHKKRNAVTELPPSLRPLTKYARQYLKKRHFNPDLLALMWGLQSTDQFSSLKFRIFIPIYYQFQVVNWQCRDITEKSKLKYIAQSLDKAMLNNKEVLYGLEQAPTNETCLIVEGVTDVWRLGPGAIATFGIKYTRAQVALLLKSFKSFNILFDSDSQAQIQARKLAYDLSAFGGKVKLLTLETGDPGDMPQKEADTLIRSIIKKGGY